MVKLCTRERFGCGRFFTVRSPWASREIDTCDFERCGIICIRTVLKHWMHLRQICARFLELVTILLRVWIFKLVQCGSWGRIGTTYWLWDFKVHGKRPKTVIGAFNACKSIILCYHLKKRNDSFSYLHSFEKKSKVVIVQQLEFQSQIPVSMY